MRLDAALDRFWETADSHQLGGIVLPEHRACVSVTAHHRGPTTQILDYVWEHVVPALA